MSFTPREIVVDRQMTPLDWGKVMQVSEYILAVTFVLGLGSALGPKSWHVFTLPLVGQAVIALVMYFIAGVNSQGLGQEMEEGRRQARRLPELEQRVRELEECVKVTRAAEMP